MLWIIIINIVCKFEFKQKFSHNLFKHHFKSMVLQKYSSIWISYFADIKFEIEKGLNGIDHTIEHIGSTSVPNLDSKPIIDIDIIYSRQDFEKIKLML